MISPESARWLLDATAGMSIRLDHSHSVDTAVVAAKARAELVAEIERAAEQAAAKARAELVAEVRAELTAEIEQAQSAEPAKKATPKKSKGGDA